MQGITFPQSNGTLAGGPATEFGTHDDVGDLPVYRGGGEIISEWKMSWKERLSALLRGRVWLRVWSSSTHPPVAVSAESPWA